MSELLRKLNYKPEFKTILVCNAPDFIFGMLEATSYTKGPVEGLEYQFAVLFCYDKNDIHSQFENIHSQLSSEDPVLWMAYPKKSSNKYKSDISRDSGWEILGQHEFEPVRQVAIDNDWSALRFRNIDYIKKFNRNKNMALSSKGKKRS